MKCATHPGVETNLRCGKCGKLICPKCLVQTPVGARCLDCARLYKLPTYQVSIKNYLVAIGTGLGMAAVGGLIWGALGSFLAQSFHLNLNLILAPGIGYTIGEVVSLSVNRKRGRGLAAIAGCAVALSYLLAILSPWGLGFSLSNILFLVLDLVAIGLGIFISVTRLR